MRGHLKGKSPFRRAGDYLDDFLAIGSYPIQEMNVGALIGIFYDGTFVVVIMLVAPVYVRLSLGVLVIRISFMAMLKRCLPEG